MDYGKLNVGGYADGALDAASLQRSFINRVFGWMTAGLAVTGGVAYFAAVKYGDFIVANRGLFFILMIAEFLLVIGLSAAIRSIAPAAVI